MSEQQTAQVLKLIRSRDAAGLDALMTTQPELLNIRIYALTPLLYATTMNRPECVKVLLAHGCDTKAIIEDGIHFKKNALQLAKATNCTEIVELLSPTAPPPVKTVSRGVASDGTNWRKETAAAINSGTEENELGLKKTSIAPVKASATSTKPTPVVAAKPVTTVPTPTVPTPAFTPVAQASGNTDNEVINLSFSLPMPTSPSAVSRFCSNCGAPRDGAFCSNCGTKF